MGNSVMADTGRRADPVGARPRRADVRQRIVETAAARFEEGGYAATTLNDIAATAGFTKGAVYSNFGSKPELLLAVWREIFDASAGSALGTARQILADGGGDDPARLAAALAAPVRNTSGWQAILAEFRALARRDPAIAERYAEIRRQHVDDLTGLLGSLGLFAGEAECRHAAVVLMGQVSACAQEYAAGAITADEVTATLEWLIGKVLR